MAAYATAAELAGYASGVVQSMALDKREAALESASRVADNHLRGRYTLPLASPFDAALVRAVCSIAIWDLMRQRGYNPEPGANDAFRDGYKDAMAWLLGVQGRTIHPDIAVTALRSPAPMIHSPNRLRGW